MLAERRRRPRAVVGLREGLSQHDHERFAAQPPVGEDRRPVDEALGAECAPARWEGERLAGLETPPLLPKLFQLGVRGVERVDVLPDARLELALQLQHPALRLRLLTRAALRVLPERKVSRARIRGTAFRSFDAGPATTV